MQITEETKKMMEENGFTLEEQDDIALRIAAVCFDKRIINNYKAKHNLLDFKKQ